MRSALLVALAGLPLLASAATSPPARPFGAALQALPTPAAADSAQPHLAVHGEIIVLSWLEPGPSAGTALRHAVLEQGRWVNRPLVASGERWFVNWADFPSVVPINASLWAAHWLQRTPGGPYSYDVHLSLSRDGGNSWSAPFVAHTDGTPAEHGFVSLFSWNGDVGALWLDGRYTSGHGSHDHDQAGAGGMTLRAGRFAADGKRLRVMEVDDLVCDCCQTDVAIASSGPVVAYRNRTPDDVRDIHVARLVDDQWQLVGAVGSRRWQVRGCPVNGAAIDAAGERVALAWYSGADDQARVELAWSVDAGASFGPQIAVDDADPLGRVDVALLGDDRGALVSWLRRAADGKRGQISLRHVDAQGRMGEVLPLVDTLAGRPSGFPQAVVQGDHLVLAWTDVQAGRVRSARIRLSDLLLVPGTLAVATSEAPGR